MGFWRSAGKLLLEGAKILASDVKETVAEYNQNYSDTYERSADRYAGMSDEELKREIGKIKNASTSSTRDRARQMGRAQAIKQEMENRRG